MTNQLLSDREPVLTIAIPSFRRAQCLDRQLAWAAASIEGRAENCELLVSYNVSGDATPEVCERWSRRLGTRFKAVRQTHITGMLPNVEFCYRFARGKYVWVVSDDEVMYPTVVGRVLDVLGSHPDVGVVHVNHRWVDPASGRAWSPAIYPIDTDRFSAPGLPVVEDCLRWAGGDGLYLMTALVFNKKLVNEANDKWLRASGNLTYVLWVAAKIGVQHPIYLIGKPLIDCPTGAAMWFRLRRRLLHYDEPEAYLKLLDLGYDPMLVRNLILSRIRTFDPRQIARFLILYPYEFPRHAIQSVGMYLRAFGLRIR